MTPPPRPDDDPPPPPAPPGGGWEVVEPADPAPRRDPLLDDPLFAEITGDKPTPDLRVERDEPPAPDAVPVADLPVARPAAVPARPPRPAPPTELAEAPKPRWVAACAVIGCFGLSLAAALAFMAYAAIALLTAISDQNAASTLRTGARPEPVAPTSLADEKIIQLPGVVDAVGRAAGGRYLLLRTPGSGEIHVFDPNVGAIATAFDIGSRQALFAGSASKLFVYRPTAQSAVLERWDLKSGRKDDVEAPRPPGVVQPDALVVGAGVDGPVWLVSVPANGVAHLREIDPETLQPTDGGTHTITGWIGTGGGRAHVRVSDDGTVLGVTTGQGAQLLRLPPRQRPVLEPFAGLARPTLATPSPDGRVAFTPVGAADVATGARRGPQSAYTFPTAHGSGLFLSLRRPAEGERFAAPVRLRPTAAPDLWVELGGVEVPAGMLATDRGDLPPDQRIHLWPGAGLALSIGTGTPQRLDVRPVNVSEALENLAQPYLVIGSEPRLWAVAGRAWEYAPTVWTDAKGARVVEKIDGPPDMQVRDGRLVWTPPATAPGGVAVTVRVSAGGQTVEQRFRLAVVGQPDDE